MSDAAGSGLVCGGASSRSDEMQWRALQQENEQLRSILRAHGLALPTAERDTAAASCEADPKHAVPRVVWQDHEEFIRSLLDSSTDCIKVLDLHARVEMMSEGGMCVMEVDDFGLIQGACWPDFWPGSGRSMALAALDEARAGRLGRFQGPAPTAKGTAKWWDVVVAPILGADGAPEKLLSVSRDITNLKIIEEALRLSRDQHETALAEHRSALAQLTEGVIFADAQGRITFVNEAAERLHGVKVLGVRPEEYASTYQVFTTDGEPYPSHELPLARAVRGEVVQEEQWRIRRGDGTEVVASGSACPIVGPDGERTGAVLTLRDETSRIATAAALSEASRRLNAILNNTTMAVFLMDGRQHCAYANAAAEQLTGYSFSDMQGRPLHDVVHHKKPDGSYYPLEECPIDRAFPERARMQGRELFVAPDGSLYPVEFTASPVVNDEGVPIGTVIEARNIAEDLAQEKALRETEERYRLAAQATHDVIWDWDMTTGGIQWNEALTDVFGYAPDDLVTTERWWNERIHPEDRERVARSLHTVIDGNQAHWSGEYRFLKADGGEVYVLDRGAVIRNEKGAAVRMIGAMVDLTERRRAEAALRELNENLENRVAQVIAEREKVEEALRQSQKLESMGQLTGGVAHDFNNLLTPIIASLDMLQRRRVGDDRTQRLVDGALQSAERAKTLVQRLLAFARRQPLQTEAVDVASLVDGMTDLVASTSGPRIRVDIDIAANLPPAKADANQVELAILNLAVNARDAMADGGTLTISAKPKIIGASDRTKLAPGRYVCLSVSDTGVGMDEATLARAIEPFFSTKGIGKGTGLGLSMVHGLAAQLGGTLNIVSKPGLGTKVELWLPTCDEPARQLTAAGQVEAPQSAGRALLVDDEELVRMSTADMLTDLGYTVVEMGSADEALRLLENGLAVDLLVTDHLMPGMTGIELAREVRTRWPDKSVLVISGYAETDGIATDLPLLTKPFRRSDLIESLASASVIASC